MYKVIIEPKTNKIININSKKGKYIISNYINFLYAGARAPKRAKKTLEENRIEKKKNIEKEIKKIKKINQKKIEEKKEKKKEEKKEEKKKEKKEEKKEEAIEKKPIKTWQEWIDYAKDMHSGFFSEDYKFDKVLSLKGDYGIIFKTNKPIPILLKLVIVWTGTDELFDRKYKDIALNIFQVSRSVIKIQQWDNEIAVLQKMSKNNIGPNLIDHNLFEAIGINLGPPQVDGGELKMGLIKMEYLYNYITLDEFIINKKENYDKELKVLVCEKIINKLKKMHEQKVCHGDLHMGNILINEDNLDIKFIDFGSSQYKELIGETVWEKESECGVNHDEIEKLCSP